MSSRRWRSDADRQIQTLAGSGSELGERHRQRPLYRHRDEGEVQELVRVGAHQAGGIADAGLAALIGWERKQVAEELLDTKRRAKLDRVGAIDLGLEGVSHLCWNPDILPGFNLDPLATTPDEQPACDDDERLLLAKVDVQWPAVRAFDGFDVRPQNLVRGAFIAPNPNTAPLQDLCVAHSLESIGRAPIRCARAAVEHRAGSSTERPPEELDAAIIFAPVGAPVPAALAAVAKGGVVVCAGIHMSEISPFSYDLLWGERVLRSVANLTRKDGEEFMELAPEVPVRTEIREFPLQEANEALSTCAPANYVAPPCSRSADGSTTSGRLGLMRVRIACAATGDRNLSHRAFQCRDVGRRSSATGTQSSHRSGTDARAVGRAKRSSSLPGSLLRDARARLAICSPCCTRPSIGSGVPRARSRARDSYPGGPGLSLTVILARRAVASEGRRC